ncbi:MAG: nicotinate-nicotinamide nucleotide adenylyltransferase [Lentisphaeria bacterium]|nr:nicotinate-nicotinamide nucleotide adenylyltransferase [Lentisphaeria bacterium]
MAVFGGSFDPVHLGHICLARQILERDLADEILFVPTKRSPFKPSSQLDSGAIRMEMLNLAVKDAVAEKETYKIKNQFGTEVVKKYLFGISDMELQRDGNFSYTFDTLTTLKHIYPDVEIKFLMGTDCLNDLDNWHQAGALIQQFNFIIYPRPGVKELSDAEIVRKFRTFGSKLLRSRLVPKDANDTLPLWDISSTTLRERIAAGEDTSELLSPSVWKFIKDKKLYQN